MSEKTFYSSGEVAEMIGVHRDVVNNALKSSGIRPNFKLGNSNAFDFATIQKLRAWIESRKASYDE